MKLRFRPEAWLDIEEAVRYLNEKAGAETAVDFYRLARETLKDLSRQPGLGRPRRDLKPAGIRSSRVAPPFEAWLIFYRLPLRVSKSCALSTALWICLHFLRANTLRSASGMPPLPASALQAEEQRWLCSGRTNRY